MNIDTFRGITTPEAAVAFAQALRAKRLTLFIDLRGEGNRMKVVSHLEPEKQARFATAVHRALHLSDGIHERLARNLESLMDIPFGWLDEPYPENELRASIARSVRLNRKIKKYGLLTEFQKRTRNTKMAQLAGGATGDRGVSKALYLELRGHLYKQKARFPTDERQMSEDENALGD